MEKYFICLKVLLENIPPQNKLNELIGLIYIELAGSEHNTIVYTRYELFKRPYNTKKILGVFTAENTYNEESEENLKQNNLPLYILAIHTVAEMLDLTFQQLYLKILKVSLWYWKKKAAIIFVIIIMQKVV